MQLSSSVDELTAEKIEETARHEAVNKSRFIAKCIGAYFRNEAAKMSN
jgi:hypothetical protein